MDSVKRGGGAGYENTELVDEAVGGVEGSVG